MPHPTPLPGLFPPPLTAVQVCQVCLADGDILWCGVLVELLVPLLKERLVMTLHTTQHSTIHR